MIQRIKLSRIFNMSLIFLGVIFLFYVRICSAYEVIFKGMDDPKTVKLLEQASQLEKLKESPPATVNGLSRRAEGDMPKLIEVLHSLAFYNAKVNYSIVDEGAKVMVLVESGPVYPIESFTFHFFQNEIEFILEDPPITLRDLDIKLGDPAYPASILTAEDLLLDKLNLKGYAFSKIIKREILADQSKKNVLISLDVETGPLTYFGPLKVTGLERVHKEFLYKKLRWKEGDLYDPLKIERTQESLEMAGLFRSIHFSQGEEPMEGNLLPLEVDFLEGKQRSIGYGVNFTSEFGPGVSGEWEDRNMFGLGQKFSIRADIWAKMQTGSFTYLIPDFQRQDQNLIWQIDYNHELTKSYYEKALSLSSTIERKWNEQFGFSYGLMYKLLNSTRSEHNGTFDLIKVPLRARWSNTDSLLDPTEGATVELRVIPSLQFLHRQFFYTINDLTTSFYIPLTEDKKHVFATKLMLGSIIGASEYEIPPPERFYAGTDNALRGYRYKTVCPIIKEGEKYKPIGGRSRFVYSLELRSRLTENFGLATFYEIGNVYKSCYPSFNKGLVQSAGLGLRYYTPVGPIRLDFAVPLNRRKYIDNPCEVYFSIGQSF